jgi:O-antigen ligase
VLVPFALVAYRMLRSRLLRGILGILILASILPFIQSANRGAWLSLAIGLVYAVVRFTGQGSLGAVLRLLVLVVAASLLVIASPLGSVVRDRLAEPGSESLRISLYEQATQAAAGSPIFGYGVPLPPPDSPYVLPNVGTQGQLWLVLVSAGLPAAVAFLAWMSYVAVASRRRRDAIGVAAHLAIVMAILQVPVYGMVPIELQVFMVAAALVWRPPREEAAGPGVAYLWTEPRVRAA